MKGIIACPFTQTVFEVEIDSKATLLSMYQHLECKLVEKVTLDTQNDIWIDEEGLFQPHMKGVPSFCSHRYIPTYLAGRILILGVDVTTGECRDTTYDVDRVKIHVNFWTREQVEFQDPSEYRYRLFKVGNNGVIMHEVGVFATSEEAVKASGVSDILPVPIDVALDFKGDAYTVIKFHTNKDKSIHNAVQGFHFLSENAVKEMAINKNNEEPSLSQIADIIEADWKKPYFGAIPYIQAMKELETIEDKYFEDDARDIVTRFLVNADRWRGPVAKKIKEQLRKMLKK
jgi:hypothetical protein